MTSLVSYKLENGVASIAMDDGKANVVSPAMVQELNAAIDQAEKDKAAILLTGRQGYFSAGFDLKVLGAGGATAFDLLMNGFRTAERLLGFNAPVVVACSGHAMAMGVFITASADYVVAADGPYKIGANEAEIGLPMPRSMTEICRSRLSPPCFNRAMLTAQLFTPPEAVAAGFVDRVVPAADLVSEALAVATRLAKFNRKAFAVTKHGVREPILKAVRDGLDVDSKQLRQVVPGSA